MGTRRYTCTVVWVLGLLLAACGDNKVPAADDDPVNCTSPEVACGTSCVNPLDDESNCGSCGNACGSGAVCISGDCQAKVSCQTGEMDCNNVCKTTQSDEENCGACGNKCSSGQTCIDGVCEATVTCTSPQVNCNNDCVDTTQDENNCGGCGNTCSSSQTCVLGQCQTTVTCTAPQIACNNVCVDPRTDEAHCGDCATACTSSQTCVPNGNTGSCQTTLACTAPQINCDNVCVDPRSDEANCGSCGNTCTSTQTCVANGNTGSCQTTVSCTAPQVDCNNTCVDLSNDDNNCGACGAPCSGSTPDCVAGVCRPLCMGSTPDLCGAICTDFDTDEMNCGACGTPCLLDGSETCTAGVCGDTCTAQNEQFCAGQGCVNTTTDNNNCGGCGVVCGSGTSCQGGTCQIVCNSPNLLCGANCINPATDNNNCGSCGNACTGGKSCSATGCVCPAGQTDCNGTCKNLQTDDANCNTCGNACASGLSCVAGSCVLVCPSGQTDCNGTCVDTQTDNQHCGNCPTTCDTGAFEQCQGGVCTLSCPASLPDACNGTCINFDNGVNGTNCGGCGPTFDCPTGQVCSNGACQLNCTGSTTLCNGACIDLMADEQNCGMCGLACPANGVCDNGVCTCVAPTPNTCPGVCTDFVTDEAHCGNCNTSCVGTQTCDNGICCSPGTLNCGGQCKNLDEDEANCGGCGIACKTGEQCQGGQCECPFGQAICPPGAPNGACQVVANDPNACGPTCQVCSGSTPFCVSNGCAATCPAPLEACGGDQCVNKKSDNNNCGACGTVCAAGTGCSDGQCVPSIPVGPDPAKCVNGGPPIVVPTSNGDTCTGSLGAVTFRYGLCSCTNVGPLGHDLTVDAFDSRFGPYNPLPPFNLGGGIGVNGTIQNTANIEAFGDFWVFGASGQATKGQIRVHDRFLNKQGFDFTALVSVDEGTLGRCSVSDDPCVVIGSLCAGTGGTCMDVGENAYIGGAIDKTSGGNYAMDVSGDLFTGTTTCAQLVNEAVTPNANDRPQDCIPQTFDTTIPPPCDCEPDQKIPVRSIVAHFANPANNDNALLTPDLDPNVLVNPTGAQRLDLPCGNYYLNQINTSNATTIVVHGHTGLYIGGSIIVSQQITFDLDPDATLDIFVAGVMKTSNTVTVGNPAFPRLSRVYFGSPGCSGSGSCQVNADCCSGVCQGNGQCLGGGGNISESVSLSGQSFLNGLFYAGAGTIRVTNPLNMNGAIFANYYDSVEANIHYDRGAIFNGEECPPPPSGCTGCQDCNNQACVNGVCGSCTDDSQCCSPLKCINGTCAPVSVQ